MKNYLLLILILSFQWGKLFSQADTVYQPQIEYKLPRTYKIANIEVMSGNYIDKDAIIQISKFKVGDRIKIPGIKITNAIRNLYRQNIFSDVKIVATKIIEDKIYLKIELQELAKISAVNFIGVNKKEKKDLTKLLSVRTGMYYNSNLVKNIKRIIENNYKKKGYLKNTVEVIPKAEINNKVAINIIITKTKKVKINKVLISGNKDVNDLKLKFSMKKTRDKSILNLFKKNKYIEKLFEEDKVKLIEKYNELGYRDAIIISDSIQHLEDNKINIHISVKEGGQYYMNDIVWVGNTIYPTNLLSRYLKIKKGDTYNKKLLDKRLTEDEDAVLSLYSNNGYLFANITPHETIKEDSLIDMEIRIYEGQAARLNKVIVNGNERTNDHVVRRELYTKPGDLFSREKIIRSIRQLSQLGHFDPERISPSINPNFDNNTVDITYNLAEKSNDQVELSGGYGGGTIIGSMGFRFSNFSVKNLLNRKNWSPLPIGDGQTFAIRGQTNGSYYNSFSINFVEPWLGGKKPNSFSVSFLFSNQTRLSRYYSVSSANIDPDRDQRFGIRRFSVGLGERLRWPDTYFGIRNYISYAKYKLDNWPGFLSITDGNSNVLSINSSLFRNSTDNPIYTRRGSSISLSLELTPPFSMFDGIDYENATNEEKYSWIEYHKWNFTSKVYKSLDRANKLVLYTGFEQGFLGYYNKNKRSPFEGFVMGGDGMTAYRSYGTDIIALRGYQNSSITPFQGIANLYSKFTMELRYPLSLSQSAQIYLLSFIEAGNSWYDFKDYNPFDLKRAAGVGIRVFLPIFGLLGIDWAYGFDEIPNKPNANGPQIHFCVWAAVLVVLSFVKKNINIFCGIIIVNNFFKMYLLMKRIIIIIVIAISISFVQAQQRYAFIDSEYILNSIPDYKVAKDEINKLSKNYQNEIETIYEQVNKLEEKYRSDKIFFSAAMREKAETQIADKHNQARQLQEKYFGRNGMLYKKRQEIIKPIQEKIYDTIKELAVANNYSMILDQATVPVIIYANARYDVSDKIIEMMGYTPQKK